ncbi:L-rhamnose-binding lectin CSL1-like [Polymixia lowei]
MEFTRAAQDATGILFHPSTTTSRSWWMCDGWQYCRLPKPNQRMFTCKMDNPFIQVSYKCHKHSPDLKTLVACDGETANVKCDEGHISIKKTNYGRLDLKTCMKGPATVTWCMSEDADETVNTLCNGKKECEIPVDTNLTTKGGCDDSPKYLILQYVCQ